jgi:rod shape determining protein RodA
MAVNQQQTGSRLSKQHFDIPLLLLTYALAVFGVIAITAATYTPSQDTTVLTTLLARVTNSYYGRWQAIFLLISPIIIGGVLSIDYRFLGNRLFSNLLYLFACFLLGLVLYTEGINNVRGWFSLIWDRTVQPAELAKVAVIIRLAKIYSEKEKPLSSFRDFARVGITLALPLALIFIQGELGSAVVFVVFFMAMTLIAGVDAKTIVAIVLSGTAAVAGLILSMRSSGSYRFERLLSFFFPNDVDTDLTYQQTGSQIAVGSGGLRGQGLFQDGSLSALNFVPEDHTDFIFSSIGETMGFIGCALLLLLYFLLILRMIILAVHTSDKFGQLMIVGVLSMMVYHVFQGVGMAIGAMPVMGIPMPFVSYGGSNLTVNMAGIGLVLNITLRKPQPTDLGLGRTPTRRRSKAHIQRRASGRPNVALR